jgi:hypothetical protein
MAYNQISSMVAAVADPVWMVVPGVAVAATLIARPSVDADRIVLLNVAIGVSYPNTWLAMMF